jgi:hypothetical protein
MESKANTRELREVDEKHIRGRLDRALESYSRSKQGAAEATAYLWLVADETRTDLGAQWLQEQIEERENEIASYNSELTELRARVGKHANGALKDADYNSEEEKAELEALVGRTKEEWAALRKLPVNPRAGASPNTALARYGLRIEKQADAPLASRYALAIQWVEEQNKRFEDAEEIVEAIAAAGGFEAVVERQRKQNAGTAVSSAADDEDRQITATALAQDAIAAIGTAPPIATFSFRTDKARNGLTRFIARYSEGRADIVGEVPLAEHEAGAVAIQLATLPTNTAADFVKRVLGLGELVAEGKETRQTVDGTKTGERIKEERTYCLLPDVHKTRKSGPRCRVLVSAAHADAGVVISASPTEGLDLGSPNGPMVMLRQDVEQLMKALEQSAAPHLVNVLPDESGGLAWLLENRALIQAGRPSGKRRFAWERLDPERPKPLDQRLFDPQFVTQFAMTELRRLYEQRLSDWGEKGAKRSEKLVTLVFKERHVTFKVIGVDDLSLDCGEIAEPVSLQFRARDLFLIARVLIQQPTEAFELRGDQDGLLGIAWKDTVGEYTIYQPTADADGRPQSRCLAPLRLIKNEAGQCQPVPA